MSTSTFSSDNISEVTTDDMSNDMARSRSPKKQAPKSQAWVFTWNNYPANWQEYFLKVQDTLVQFVAGEEVAPTTGTPHIQGYLKFKGDRNRYTALKLPKQICFNPAKGTAEQNYDYTTKDETNVLCWGCQGTYKVNIELRPWQIKMNSILDNHPDDRKIYWCWEPYGGLGKTTYQKWVCQNYPDVLVLGGKAADMKNGIVQWQSKHNSLPRTIILNLPKTFNTDYWSATGTEEVKDMLFYSGKYEGGMVNGRPPHVIIFANCEPPNTEELAADRWVIIRLPNGKAYTECALRLDWSDE